jgi:phospho-N-acetylmuramoyl-pentapeptide-transferase
MLKALYDIANQNDWDIPGVGVFKYISLRAALAIILSLVISVLIGKRVIDLLRRKLIGESIRDLGPESHKKKAGTPTMGGLIILAAIIIPTLICADLTNAYVQLVLFSTIWMGAIGFLDDYIKVFRKNKAGLKGKFKIVGQVGLGLIVGCTMVFHPQFRGPIGHISDDGTIDVTIELEAAGFQKGDKLVKVGMNEFKPVERKHYNFRSTRLIVLRKNTNVPGVAKDYNIELKLSQKDSAGVMAYLFEPREKDFATQTDMPFVKDQRLDYDNIAFWQEGENGIWGKLIYIFFAIFVVTAVSNGVNITDGLDGLAAGTSAVASATLAVFCWVSGNAIFSSYLYISHIPAAAELVIFCAALVGACVGFLWYNAHPAQVFMGDTGSLALGGVIGVLALMVKKELLLPLICGVFFIELFSVTLQVAWFKYTKRKYGEGRRIFKMAPMHHHYELGGMHEAKITTRFWILATMFCLLAFVTLKLR